MKFHAYSLQDRMVSYSTPFFVPDCIDPNALAIRNVRESLAGVNIEQLMVKARYIDLVKIGTFDDKLGIFVNEEMPTIIANAENIIGNMLYKYGDDEEEGEEEDDEVY